MSTLPDSGQRPLLSSNTHGIGSINSKTGTNTHNDVVHTFGSLSISSGTDDNREKALSNHALTMTTTAHPLYVWTIVLLVAHLVALIIFLVLYFASGETGTVMWDWSLPCNESLNGTDIVVALLRRADEVKCYSNNSRFETFAILMAIATFLNGITFAGK